MTHSRAAAIIALAAGMYDVSPDDVIGAKRTMAIREARQLAAVMLRMAHASYEDIGFALFRHTKSAEYYVRVAPERVWILAEHIRAERMAA